MKKNIETNKRAIKVLIAAIIAFLYLSIEIGGFIGLIIITVSVVLLPTVITYFRKLNFLLAVQSIKKKS